MAQKGRGIFMVYVDIDAQHVQEFNEWYNKEHLPELLSVPGILSAARYEAVKGGPQYGTVKLRRYSGDWAQRGSASCRDGRGAPLRCCF